MMEKGKEYEERRRQMQRQYELGKGEDGCSFQPQMKSKYTSEKLEERQKTSQSVFNQLYKKKDMTSIKEVKTEDIDFER